MRIIVTTLAAVAALLFATPAQADDAETCAPETFTAEEYEQLAVGMFMKRSFKIVGSPGILDREATYSGPGRRYQVRQWAYCEGGVSTNRQAVVFGLTPEGRWAIAEIG